MCMQLKMATRMKDKRTRVPNDQMSVAVFQGISMRISGLDHIGVPTRVPDVAHSESTG